MRGDVSPRSVVSVARSFLLPWAVLGFPRVLSCYFGCSWFNTLLELIRPLPAETSRSHEMSGSSSTAEAASDEAAAAMMTMPGADSALLRYSGLRRGAWSCFAPFHCFCRPFIFFSNCWRSGSLPRYGMWGDWCC